MPNLFQASADFYSQFPTPIVRDGVGKKLEKGLQAILKDSLFLSKEERSNMPRLLPFFGTKALVALRDSLVRKNLRRLITNKNGS